MAAATVYNAPDDGRKGLLKHVVVNKHNTARVASCLFIIYYRLGMHGNSNIKLTVKILRLARKPTTKNSTGWEHQL